MSGNRERYRSERSQTDSGRGRLVCPSWRDDASRSPKESRGEMSIDVLERGSSVRSPVSYRVPAGARKETHMKQSHMLAWSQYPEPTGTSYAEHDLICMETVIELLDRAEIFRAHITPEGWRWLWSHYKLDGLLALNRRGGWFDTEDEDLATDQIVRRTMIGGYDPIADGSYRPTFRSRANANRPKKNDRNILELIRNAM
jgi:hypothetical protein